jgi:hypothetical protein
MENWKRILLKAAGAGAGAALALVVCVAVLNWVSNRPKQWSDVQITAKISQQTIQMSGEEVHLSLRYALTNHSKEPYSLPSSPEGVLTRRDPEDKSLVKCEDASWDSSLTIPPGQTFNEVFTLVYKLSDYDTTSAELSAYGPEEKDRDRMSKAYLRFIDRRFDEMDGLVFYDYLNNYRIELPRNWELKKPD